MAYMHPAAVCGQGSSPWQAALENEYNNVVTDLYMFRTVKHNTNP